MSDAITVVYVDSGPVGAAIEAVRGTEDVRLIRTETGTDALKRLHTEPAGALVLPATTPDVDLGEVVTRAREAAPSVAIFVVGDGGGEGRGATEELPPGVVRVAGGDGRTLANRLRAAVGDRRMDEALHRHERLEVAGLRLAQAAVAASDRSDVERAVHDELVESGAYRFVWVGRYRPESAELDVSYPLPGRFSLASVAESVGAEDGNFLAEAVETGSVVVQRSDDATRSAAAVASGESTGTGGTAFAAVPFVEDGRVHGVAILGTADGGAFDSTERSLLGRFGSIVGYAIAAGAPPRPEPGADPERIQRFVDALAHELRNPLQIATSYLAIGREHGEEEAFDRVDDALDTIGEIIDSAVALAGEGGIEEIVPVDVGVAAMDVWGEIDADGSDVTIVDSPTVRADPDALDRVLSNLFRNAIDHGGPDVSVRVGSLADGPGFYVEDDGPGIPPGDRESVFEWGYSTSETGLGIGLGFVREIVDAHGWRITVESGEEGGARFEIHTATEDEPAVDGETEAVVETAADDEPEADDEPQADDERDADDESGADTDGDSEAERGGSLDDLFEDWEPPGESDTGSFEFPRRS